MVLEPAKLESYYQKYQQYRTDIMQSIMYHVTENMVRYLRYKLESP